MVDPHGANGINVPKVENARLSRQPEDPQMNITPGGIDTARNVFQVHYVDRETGEIVNEPIKRAQFLGHFANRSGCPVGTDGCSGAY